MFPWFLGQEVLKLCGKLQELGAEGWVLCGLKGTVACGCKYHGCCSTSGCDTQLMEAIVTFR